MLKLHVAILSKLYIFYIYPAMPCSISIVLLLFCKWTHDLKGFSVVINNRLQISINISLR